MTQGIINPKCLELLAGIAKLRKVTFQSPWLNQKANGVEEIKQGWVIDRRIMSIALSHSKIYHLEPGGVRNCH